jgi:hypothetical protein
VVVAVEEVRLPLFLRVLPLAVVEVAVLKQEPREVFTQALL